MKKNYSLIFGCGYYGRAIFRKIKKKNVIFLDNSRYMKKCLGKKVILPSDIIKKKLLYNKIYLAGRYIDEQILQLKKLKLYKKIKIFKNYELVEKKKNLIKREKKILEILKILINNLNKYRVSYWLDRSSLLAIYRSQLLSELSDVDISIDIIDFGKLKKILKTKLPKKIIVHNKKILIGKKKLEKFFLSSSLKSLKKNEPALIDFIFRKIKNNKVYSCGISLKNVPLKMIKQKKHIQYKNINITVPKNSKKYLKFIYGNNWKIKASYYLKSSRI